MQRPKLSFRQMGDPSKSVMAGVVWQPFVKKKRRHKWVLAVDQSWHCSVEHCLARHIVEH